MSHDALQRFSTRTEDYARYRPAYPKAAVDLLTAELGGPASVADLGAGTGIFTAQLLAQGHTVFAVEPNTAMRAALAATLGGEPRLHVVDGQAEATGLPPASVDATVAAQAFHWFDPEKTRAECLRILRPGGLVFLLWNERLVEGAFLEEYERLLQVHAIDYAEVDHRRAGLETVQAFYGGAHVTARHFSHEQTFDWEGLAGRTRSCSYVPGPEHAGHAPLMSALRLLFDSHARDGRVVFRYQTQLYGGALR